MSRPLYQLKAEFFKTLGHPARIRVLELLSEREHAVSEMLPEVGIEPAHLSQQLAVLRRANLVVSRKEGSAVYYSLTSPHVAELLAVDAAVIAYANLLRVQGWVGTAAIWLEHEAFGLQPPGIKLRQQHGSRIAESVNVDAAYRYLGQQLVPLLDRANTMLARNLRQLQATARPTPVRADTPPPMRLVVDRSA